jgi:protein TonB
MMRAKKSKKADVDRHKGLFFRTGLLLSFLFVIWAFRFTTEEKSLVLNNGMNWEDETLEIPPIDFPEKKLEQPKPQAFKLNEKDDDEEVNDSQNKLLVTDFNIFDTANFIFDSFETYTGPTEPIVGIAEKMPDFPGGERALFEYLKANIVYPEMEREAGIQGTVVVYFVVEKNGSLSDVKIIGGRGNTPNMNKESLRVKKQMPNWSPGYQGNRKVRVSIKLPIHYKLSY